MAVYLSPIGNGFQWLGQTGLLLSGGKINTYAAGSTTPTATFTDNTGTVANANPIILDSTGRYAQEIWFTGGQAYKFVVTDALGVTQFTLDNLPGIGDPSVPIPNNLLIPVTRFGAVGDGVTNNFTAFTNAIAYCKALGATLWIPPGNFVIDTSTGSLTLEYVKIQGTGSINGTATPGSTGSVISITGTANPPFLLRRSVTVDGIGFLYPAQVDSATPIVFPPTFQVDITDGAVQFVWIQNCVVFNAYRFFVDTDTTGAIGHIYFNNNVIYGILSCFEVSYNSEVMKWQGNNFTFGHFLAATEGGLRGYTRANGSVMIWTRTDGFIFSNNMCYGYLNALSFVTSATICQLLNIEGNLFDSVRFSIKASGTGNIIGSQVVGNSFVSENPSSNTLQSNAINVSTSGALQQETLTVVGNNFFTCATDQVLVSGVAVRSYTITGNNFFGWAAFQVAGSYAALNISGASTSYVATGNTFLSTNAFSSGILGSCSEVVCSGNVFGSCVAAVNVTANSFIAYGNVSYSTSGATSDIIVANNIYQFNNFWDKAGGQSTRPEWHVTISAAQTFAASSTNVNVNFGTTIFDKAGNWSSPTWTAKQTGRYRFNWALTHDNTATAGERWTFALVPSSGTACKMTYTTIADFHTISGSGEFDLANNATVNLQATQNTGTHALVELNDGTLNYLVGSIQE
jgi:hypothetical protein